MTTPIPQLSHPAYRPDIDGLRAVAVLAVVIFHAFPSWLKGGFIGVDVFFVISGFLITTIIFENLDQGTFSFSGFYARRIKRIFPALLLMLIACFAFGWFALLADEYKQLGKHIAAGAGFVSNFVLWGEAGYFDNSADTKPLLHLWSLGIEEQFYIVWPFVLWSAWKIKFNPFALTLGIVLISFILNVKGVSQDAVATFYSPQTRFWELLSGSTLAWCAHYKKNPFAIEKLRNYGWPSRVYFGVAVEPVGHTLRSVISFIGCLLLAYGFWRITKNLSFPGMWALVPVLGAVFLIMAGSEAWINRRLLSNRYAVWVGLVSFPLYLWHWPLLSFARIVEGEVPSATVRISAILISVFLAWLTYRFVERPVRFGNNDRNKVVLLVLLTAFVGLFGYSMYLKDGYESRPSIQGLVNNKNELVRTPATDESCLAYIMLKNPLFTYCRFTNTNSSETVAVVGDSHAHVAYPGISEFLKNRGKNTVLLANSNCPPFIGSPTGTNQTERDACNKRMEQLLQVIERKKDIKKVFLFTRGPVYTKGTEPLTGSFDVSAGEVIPLERFVDSAQISINRLTAKGKTVFYVSENPELYFHPNACIKRPLKRNTRDCVVKKNSVYARQSDYRNAFTSLRNVTFIDSLPAFCSADQCLVFDERGALLYADSDHLSVAGSRFQVNNLLLQYLE